MAITKVIKQKLFYLGNKSLNFNLEQQQQQQQNALNKLNNKYEFNSR